MPHNHLNIKRKWDNDLLEIFRIPKEILPKIKSSSALFGKTKKELLGEEIPVNGMTRDQEVALFGQACFEVGDCKKNI